MAALAPIAAAVALAIGVLVLAIDAAAHLLPWSRAAALADTLTPLAGHVLIGTLAALLALLVRRRHILILVVSVPTALGLHAALTLVRLPAEPAPRTTGSGVRIYALNTWDDHPDLASLEHALAALDADVLVLSEIDAKKRSMITRLAKRYDHVMSCAHRTECAMVLLSRLPVLAGGADRGHNDMPPIAWAQVDASTRGGGTLTIVGTHVHRPTRDTILHRRQMQTLAGILQKTPGAIVLAGDLNTSPWSASYRQLLSATRLAPAHALLPTWPMWPLTAPQVAIDHVLVTYDIEVVAAGPGAGVGSDHAPLIADVRVRRPADAKTASNPAP